MKNIIDFKELGLGDLETVGGKNSSLGEMIKHLTALGVKVPGGFATTTEAYTRFLTQNGLDNKINEILAPLDSNNVMALRKASSSIRQLIIDTPFLADFEQEVIGAYAKLNNASVAVRSSATSEDLPDASFAGQHETFLNVEGNDAVLLAIKRVFASLFTERAISYRNHKDIPHDKVTISAGIQRMIRSDLSSSGVMFTLDTESGFDKVIFITASYGLGEAIVQGSVNPDEFYVHKPTLQAGKFPVLRRVLGAKALKMIYAEPGSSEHSIKIVDVLEKERLQFCIGDSDIQTLAKQALIIEKHYGMPMDIEWAKDGLDGELYIVQARPETVRSHQQQMEHYQLIGKGEIKATGRSVGQRIVNGVARLIKDPKSMQAMQGNEILVTDMTDPDWEPIMKQAAGIVTNRGGRTCHAAIIARELGIPAVIGCGDATQTIVEGEPITVSCAEGETGHVYGGLLEYKVDKLVVDHMPTLPIKLCLNLGNPDKAFTYQFLPNDGIGLARLEFIITNMIGIHPSALLQLDTLPAALKDEILKKTAAYASPVEFYIEKLREGIATIAASFYPKPIIFRFSDFKSNEYANLVGGKLFEPEEENPMLGFRGASRYLDARFRDCFALECEAFKRVINDMGLDNTQMMVPFARTVDELRQVIELIESHGLKRGKNCKIFMMCELPSNVLLADQFLEYVDGFSIGSNDLTQLTLGLDRDSALIAHLFDERNEAVKIMLSMAIKACQKAGKYVGICGQAPSDYPELAEWLMEQGIQAISLNPDTIIETWLRLGK